MNSVIIGGICISNNVTVGAGALKDFPNKIAVAGSPARIIRQRIESHENPGDVK